MKPCSVSGGETTLTIRTTPRLDLAAPTAGDTPPGTGCPAATAGADPRTVLCNRLEHDVLGAKSMSIDTPSYARSLGMGQPGCTSGFDGDVLDAAQDLAQSMSIDGAQQMFNNQDCVAGVYQHRKAVYRVLTQLYACVVLGV